MTLVPYTPWLCLRCLTVHRCESPGLCCRDQAVIRVRIDEPDPVEEAA